MLLLLTCIEIGTAHTTVKLQHSWLFFGLLCLFGVLTALWLGSGTDARLFERIAKLSLDHNEWFSKPDRVTAVSEAWPATLGQSVRPALTRGIYSPAASGHKLADLGHTKNDRQVCSRPPTKARSEIDTRPVYKWVDEGGRTHLSDRQPEGHIASVIDLGMAKQDFSYEIIPDGMALPIDFQGQLAAGSKRMYDTWHFFLGEKRLRQSRIQLLLMGDPDRFDAYYAKGLTVPGSRQVAGFYRITSNEAVVKYDAKRPARNLRTTFHEVSHLITASHLGPTPPWLTEGLAEYFEMMEVSGLGGTIHPNRAHIKLLQSTPLPPLEDFLAIDRSDWYREERDRNYAMAWSVINFLLGGAPGMYALQETVQQAHENFCKPFSAATALSHAYPGGIRQLEIDWKKWRTAGKYSVQQL
jgi:hypothetical protein